MKRGEPDDIQKADALSYSMKEISLLTGVSHQSIRMYEKYGILPKTTEENGYRYYRYPDLIRSVFLRFYAGAGVPVKKTGELINGTSMEKTNATLNAQIEQIERHVELEQALIDSMRLHMSTLRRIPELLNQCKPTQRPAFVVFNCCDNNGHVVKSKEVEIMLKEWTALIPIAVFATLIEKEEWHEHNQISSCYMIEERFAGLLPKRESPLLSKFEPCLCLETIIRVSNLARDYYSMLRPVHAWIRENHYEISGAAHSVPLANKLLQHNYPNDPSDYYYLWIPVKKTANGS